VPHNILAYRKYGKGRLEISAISMYSALFKKLDSHYYGKSSTHMNERLLFWFECHGIYWHIESGEKEDLKFLQYLCTVHFLRN
jgi:hypothetical protein